MGILPVFSPIFGARCYSVGGGSEVPCRSAIAPSVYAVGSALPRRLRRAIQPAPSTSPATPGSTAANGASGVTTVLGCGMFAAQFWVSQQASTLQSGLVAMPTSHSLVSQTLPTWLPPGGSTGVGSEVAPA